TAAAATAAAPAPTGAAAIRFAAAAVRLLGGGLLRGRRQALQQHHQAAPPGQLFHQRPEVAVTPAQVLHDRVGAIEEDFNVQHLLAALGAQVGAHLVDDLDAEVAQPVVPAVGADGRVDAPAEFVVHGRLRQLAGVGAGDAAGPLAAEAAPAGGRRTGPLRLR